MGSTKKSPEHVYSGDLLWPEPGSNRRPSTFQADALPTELSGRNKKCYATLTGLEPATSAVTGRRANQLRHRALLKAVRLCGETPHYRTS